MAVKATCPGCRAILTIDRPHEPRTAPCPRCQVPIRVPEDLKPSASKTALVAPAKQEGSADKTQQRLFSVPMFFAAGGLLLGTVVFFQSAQTSASVQPAVEAESTTFNKEEVLDELAEFESMEQELKAKIRNLESDIEGAKSRLEKQLNTTRSIIREIPDTLKGEV